MAGGKATRFSNTEWVGDPDKTRHSSSASVPLPSLATASLSNEVHCDTIQHSDLTDLCNVHCTAGAFGNWHGIHMILCIKHLHTDCKILCVTHAL